MKGFNKGMQASDKLCVDVLTTREQFSQVAAEWESALLASSQASLWISHNWVSCWLASFGENSEFRILVSRDASGITGFCLLELEHLRFGFINMSCVRLLTNDYSPYSDVVILRRAEETVHALMQEIEALPWKVFEFGTVLDHSKGLLAVAEQWGGQFSHVVKRDTFELPFIAVSISWEDYVKHKSRNFRESVKRKAKSAKSLTCKLSDTMALNQVFEDIIEVSKHTWQHREGTSLARSEYAWQFYQAIMKTAYQNGRLSCVLLYEGSYPVAFMFGVRYDDTLYLLKMGYNEKFHRMSPGFNALAHFTRIACIEPNTKWIDLGLITNHSEYKRRWATRTGLVSDYRFFRKDLTGLGLGMAYRGMKKLKKMPKGKEK